EIDPNDHKRWIVHLRQGVTFHDGCKFTAGDVVWNYQYRTDEKAPYFLAQQMAYSRTWMTNVKSVSKIDDYTVAFENNFVESLFPYSLSYVMMVSQCRAKELNYDWAQYALHPSGTGPYKFDRLVAHQRLELVPNSEYWDKARIPKQDRLVLIPMPDASTRTAALLSGQVNWIEAPSPDASALLKEAGCLPCKVTFGISTSGSGQMQPLPMNELVKAQLEEAGFEVSIQAMDWNTLLDVYRGGVEKNPNYDGLNFSRGLLDPVNA